MFSSGYDRPALDFDAIRLRIASPRDILEWSRGEVTKPETINYRTQKPEREGLFSEVIFGPTKDYECYCGKYKRVRYKGIVCDKCGVEVTRSVVRRERMGHIAIAAPVAHIWFVRGVPSKIGMVLNLSMQEVEKVVYFASFVVTKVDEALREQTMESLKQEFKTMKKQYESEAHVEINRWRASQQKAQAGGALVDEKELGVLEKKHAERLADLEKAVETARKELEGLQVLAILSEQEYQDLSLKYGHIFEAGIGAEAIYELLVKIDLEKEIADLEKEIGDGSTVKQRKFMRRLRLISSFKKNGIRPEWMILTHVPIIPPDLRPMVQLDGGRFATSDLNDLYRRVINRNNRLKRLLELNAPEVITRNEKRMLQEAVDSLIDNNARHGKTVTASTGQRRVLRSIADLLKGKQGRFRQNLLGKRIDYSGRSVIVVGPRLKLHQCGLPKIMALELFKPFVMSKLIQRGIVHNVRSANRYIENGSSEVWDILEESTKKAYVLLNRAPTLHRLGIQAFQPILIEGKAIQVHPLVCPAFNADFDGDQMAVHVPLTEEARWEAANLMLSAKNLLKPATGDPITTPQQDLVWGAHYMTTMIADTRDHPKYYFGSWEETLTAYHQKIVHLQERIYVMMDGEKYETTVGRIIFNQILPEKLRYVNTLLDKKSLRKLVGSCLEQYGLEQTAEFLDELMQLAFRYVTVSGMSWGMGDLPVLSEKKQMLEDAQKNVDTIHQQYAMGLLTVQERHDRIIEVWAHVKDRVMALSRELLGKQDRNPVFSMIESGARGSWGQTTQMMGMKGLVTSPSGDTIELPVTSSFREGFEVLEYFISTHGARKGLTDIALRTANAGYLTRRLVDVSQDVVVTETDCKSDEGVTFGKEETEEIGKVLGDRAMGRVLLEDVVDADSGEVVLEKGALVSRADAKKIDTAQVDHITVRSLLTCRARRGVCQQCYGYDLGYNRLVEQGTAVGIIAAQSIGEPGTQLTMRTFHTGGVAGKDITQGLPRVEEIFECRAIRKGALLSEVTGTAKVTEKDKQKIVTVSPQDKSEPIEYVVPSGFSILVKDGELVNVGDALTEGSQDLHELYRLRGRRAVEKYVIREIQQIYSSQGQDLNDKHLEIIIRQLFSRVIIMNEGGTRFSPGSVIDRTAVEEENVRVKKQGGKGATCQELLMGMTKAALATSSFLSAASFQETARVLIDAAITGKIDNLNGLKENVIIGRLIPAGTGYKSGRLEREVLKASEITRQQKANERAESMALIEE
ncbi:MAG: DNA-directed RNA polymerase subunit beta' [Candidatus Jacksonbacteria bacterium RIFCSPHIGHO2_02_FULL_43_10]|nr:MAG: DNA-directed RNA polymerase subunit beta' [Candidatus Jacksonbacteria bacterium RIFCSPHIGHO2_02_FULL_43_10]